MRLAERLGRSEVTEATKFHYYFIALVVYTTVLSNISMHALYAQSTLNIYDYIDDVIFITSSLGTTLLAFRVNSAGNNQDLIARLTCLTVPIAIQGLLVMFVIYLAAAIVTDPLAVETIQGQSSGDEASAATDGLDLFATVVFALYFNGQLIRGIHRASKQKPKAGLTPFAA
jgi:hypothetical protein